MNPTPSWDLYASFLAVRRTGSLSGAARALGVAQPTVRRHVEALEAALGAPLFTRSPTGIVETAAAAAIAPYADAMNGMAEALVRAATAASAPEGGVVRLSCSEIMAAEVLPYLLAPLLDRQPDLVIELVATDRLTDLLRRDADIAVRLRRPDQSGLFAKRLRPIALGLFASRDYLRRRPAPSDVAALVDGHRLVGEDRETAVAEGFRAAAADPARLFFVFRSDSDAAQLAAIRAGMGVGVCQVGLGMADPSLAPVLPDMRAHLDLWLAAHEDLRGQPRIRTVLAHLSATLSAYAAGAAVRAAAVAM